MRSNTARVFVVLAAVTSGWSCATNRANLYTSPYPWRNDSRDVRRVLLVEHPDVVRITTASDDRFVIEDARLEGDSIAGKAVFEDGRESQSGYHFPVDDVARVEWSQKRTNIAPVMVATGVAAVLFFVARAALGLEY